VAMPRKRTVPVDLHVRCTICGGRHTLHGGAIFAAPLVVLAMLPPVVFLLAAVAVSSPASGRVMSLPSPAECAAWFAAQFERPAVVLAGTPLEGFESRRGDLAMTLRRISARAARGAVASARGRRRGGAVAARRRGRVER
jgi:hypothetical protein